LSNAFPTGAVHPLPIFVLEKPAGSVWQKPVSDISMEKKPEYSIFLVVQFREWGIKILLITVNCYFIETRHWGLL
jgi:hypothetical protein